MPMPQNTSSQGPIKYNTPLSGLSVVGAIVTGGLVISKVINKIKNDIRRKSLLEDLRLNDPLLRDIDKAQLMEWYATIVHFAPTVSLDKNAVREILQGFARFGRIDLQTLKMLADTEKSMATENTVPWGSVLKMIS
ncbi:hypothetical protein [Desulfovibrio piger]|uniref:hypothetical protein n=1 Tax=Desulfovibrio piger TaxID=901 RepID=UPI0026F324AC|nr:hypothetical protein [Desulfovibrio piger]